MTDPSEHPTNDRNHRRPFQFTIRGLLALTLVVSLVLSIWRSLGLVAIVLVLTAIVAGRCGWQVDRLRKADRGKKPLLALAWFAAIVIYCFASVWIMSMLCDLVAPFISLDVSDALF